MDSATPYNGISFVLSLAVVYINTKKGDYRNALDQFKVCIYKRARQPLPRWSQPNDQQQCKQHYDELRPERK